VRVHDFLEAQHVGRRAARLQVGVVQGDVEVGQFQQRGLCPQLAPGLRGHARQAPVERLLAGAAREDE